MRWIVLAFSLLAFSCQRSAELSVKLMAKQEWQEMGFEARVQVSVANQSAPVKEFRMSFGERTVCEVPARLALKVRVTVMDGERESEKYFAYEAVEPIEPGKRSKVFLAPQRLGNRFHARFLDRETGEALVGLRFTVSDWRLGVAGVPKIPSLMLEDKQTDSNGDVALQTIQSDGYHGYPVVETVMPGYNLTQVSLSPRHGTVETRAIYHISRSASLTVSLAGRSLDPGQEIRLFKAKTNNPYRRSQDTPNSRRTLVKPQDGVLSKEGLYEFLDVPSDVPLELKIVTTENVLHVSKQFSLQPQEARSMEWALDMDELVGKLVCDSDLAVQGVQLWLLREVMQSDELAQKCLLKSSEERFLIAQTETDSTGHFRFPGLAAGTWWVGIAPEQDSSPFAPAAFRVDWDPTAPVDIVEIPAWQGRSLSGRVLDPQGQAQTEAWVRVNSREWGALPMVYTNAQGEFRFNHLPVEEVYVVATAPNHGYASAQPVLVGASESDQELTLQLRPGSVLSGTALLPAGQGGTRAELVISRTGGGGQSASTRSSGEFEFDGLEPGEWALAASTQDGLAGWTRVEVESGQTLQDIQIPLRAAVMLRVEAPEAWQRCVLHVHSNGVLFAWPTISLNGSCTIVVPAGELSIETFLPGGEKAVQVYQGLVAEGDTTITLREE